MFARNEFTPFLLSQMLEDREQITHQPKSDDPSGQGWSRVGKKRANEKAVPNAKPAIASTGRLSKNNVACCCRY